MNTFIQKMPKAELHLHLEGAVRPDTAAYLYNQCHDPIPAMHVENLYEFSDLKTFIQGMQRVSDNIRTPEHLHRITRELLETCALQNIIYLEFDCAFQKYVMLGQSLPHIIQAITDSMKEAESLYGIKSRILGNFQRSHRIDQAIEIVKQIVEINNPYMVGIGLSGYELSGDVGEFAPVFEIARQNGLHLTAHAGEIAGPQSIWDVIEKLRVERIDHGTRAFEDDKLINYLVKHQIPLTQCLSSNVRLHVCNHYKQHPFPDFYKKGMCVTLNTDDPEVFHISLTGEYQKAASYYRLTSNDLFNIVNNTIEAAFIDQDEKKVLLKKVEDELKKIEHSKTTVNNTVNLG